MEIEDDKYYTVKQVAAYFMVSPAKMYEMVNMGEIGFLKIGGAYRISGKDIRAFEGRHHYKAKRRMPF